MKVYIKQTDFGFGIFIRGQLIIEFATYEEAEEYLAERKDLYNNTWN